MSRGYLLDTNVVSATAPERQPEIAAASKAVARAWVIAQDGKLFLPVVAIAEIALGIGRLDGAGASRQAAALAVWLETTVGVFATRVLDLDRETALHARLLGRKTREAGIAPGFADLAIAAIALRHDLTVATRNVRHFVPLGVATVDPFAA